MRVWAVSTDMQVTNENAVLTWITDMSKTAPDIITGFNTFTALNDGRHRVFQWGVPRDNGEEIQRYRLRRTYTRPRNDIPSECKNG